MNQLQNFNFNNLQVRTVLIENEPWFVAKDVADILEYSETAQMTRRLDKEDSMSVKLTGMNMKSTIINESGLYEAIIGSKKKETRPFKRWITHEVLPTIRKHGVYMTDANLEEVLLNPDMLINLATQLKDERQARLGLEKENSQLSLELEEATERTRYLDLILESPDKMTTTQIAFDYGMGAPTFNKLLASLKIQRKVNRQWILYRPYMGKGYTKTETFPVTHRDGRRGTTTNTVWTQKGREFLYRKLKKNGYLPLVEQDDLVS